MIQKSNLVKGPPFKEILSLSFFLEFIRHLIDSLESKICLWYHDDGNLGDDYRTVVKHLKQNVEAEKSTDAQIQTYEMFFFGDISEKR